MRMADMGPKLGRAPIVPRSLGLAKRPSPLAPPFSAHCGHSASKQKGGMAIGRRHALNLLLGVGAVVAFGRSAAAVVGATPRMTKRMPSFELQGTKTSLESLAHISGYKVEGGGGRTAAVWLKGDDGQIRLLSVDQRDALPMFEVFTLAVATMGELEARWREWKPPTAVPEGVPEWMRALMLTRPTMPTPPTDFIAWPFAHWRTQVLRRAEFIVEDVAVGKTVGDNPNMQSAAPPMSVPKEASASCEVAAGVLFSDASGKRLLMGVDWMPLNMVVLDEAAKIDDYLKPCEAVELAAYLERVDRPA